MSILLTKVLKGQNIEDFFSKIVLAAPLAAVATIAPIATNSDTAAKKEEKSNEEETDVKMSGLFDDDY